MSRPPLILEPAHTALVIVECQNGVVGASSSLADLVVAAKPVLPVIGRLARSARAAGVRVVHLTYLPVFEGRSANRKSPLMTAVLGPGNAWSTDDSASQVVDEIGVGPDDLVLPRYSGVSPTHRTELFPLLRNAGVDGIVLAGVSLNVAIPVIAAEAADEGFRVAVPRDAVAGTPEEHAESVIRYTLRVLAEITTAQDTISAWS